MKPIVAAVSIMFLSGCSFLGNVSTLRAVEDTPGWSHKSFEEAKYDHPSFKKYVHSRDDLTVTLCTSPHTWSPLSFGPPLIPIFPVAPFMGPIRDWPDGLFMYVQLESRNQKARIDFAKVSLRVNGKSELLPPVTITRYGKDPRWDNRDVCDRTSDYRDEVDALQEVYGDPGKFVIRFDVRDNDVSAAELHIGWVRIGNYDAEIPPLRYERVTSYLYVPFVIPPEGKPLGFVVFSGKIYPGFRNE